MTTFTDGLLAIADGPNPFRGDDFMLASLNRLDMENPERPFKVLKVTKDRDGLETDEIVDSFDEEDAALCEAEILNDSDASMSLLGHGDSLRYVVVESPAVES